MASQPSIQDTLQAEFSPPLDTSLIAAIVADYISGNDAQRDIELGQLREVLRNLAAEAEKEILDSDERSVSAFSQLHISPTSLADDTSSSYDFSITDNSGYASTSSATSESSGQPPLSSPLGFLRAVFPHVSLDKLRDTLAAHGANIDDLDMEALVEEILTSEYVRELEERGLSESESMEMGYEPAWEVVEKKKGVQKQKKPTKKGTTIKLVDVRQQHHARPAASNSRPGMPDPWTQLASVASHLATLIPSHSPSFFQSVFHSPQYPTPAHALRAALTEIARKTSNATDEVTEGEGPLLFSMFEVLTTSSIYADLNVEERDQLLEDALFALRATGGNPNTALDVVQLLVELDVDFSSKQYAWGVYHQKAPQSKTNTNLPSGPPPIPPPPNTARRTHTIPSPAKEKPSASPNAWQTVPIKPGPDGPHPLSGVIRAYNNPVSTSRKVKGSGNGQGKGGKWDVGELHASFRSHRTRTWELLEQRRAALREAGKAWQSGHSKNHGGEIAFYFAERARELQQQAQSQQLDSARDMVMRTRVTTPNADSIDLHGTVVKEAVAISREFVAANWKGKPLRIITGRGKHSTNGIGVLGPAVKNALAADGWRADTFDGGVTVRGLAR
ncbi:hypothetical protein K466DRAFT_651704 [Polyporus arcularius HHB13444]|uniref:Smr domain-containing protein n=1 Tax=Polyporus arcularius HHB13444 TaxID=1314778 RepID=A0A5C3PK33_9APHY|nr:hypothetical protein K466DRAFT_651704 [Polyporus arcularius HHB13444]